MNSFLAAHSYLQAIISRFGPIAGLSILCCGSFAVALAQNASHGAKPVRPSAERLAEAGKIFTGTCAGCHGLDGRGSERGPNIASRQEVVRRSDADLLRILHDGISETGMPNFAALGDARLEALVRYLRNLQGKSGPAPIPGNPQRGEVLFFGAARCADCHMLDGKGGFIGSDLSSYASDSSPEEVRLAILKPEREVRHGRGALRVTLEGGKVLEGVVRNDDNFSLQLQSRDGAFHFIQKREVVLAEPSTEFRMPDTYGHTLAAAEIDDIVGYLMTVARSSAAKTATVQKHNDD